MSELLPCPFCGGNDVVCCDQGDDDFAVTCKTCGASSVFEDDRVEAVGAWNTRHPAPTRPEPNDAERLLGKMDVVQAYADAAYIASIHAHHALWHGLLAYGWDESTEKFGMALADRISKAISVKATKIGMGDGTSSTATTKGAEPVAWRWRLRGGNDLAWIWGLEKPTGPSIHCFEVQPLYATPPSDAAREALREMTEACEADCGVPAEDDEDDEAVGASADGPMALTFGMLRRARAALAPPRHDRGGQR